MSHITKNPELGRGEGWGAEAGTEQNTPTTTQNQGAGGAHLGAACGLRSGDSPWITCVTWVWKFSKLKGVRKPREPRWNAMTGGTLPWGPTGQGLSSQPPTRHLPQVPRGQRLAREVALG